MQGAAARRDRLEGDGGVSLMNIHALCIDCGQVERVENPREGYYYRLVHVIWPKGHAVIATFPKGRAPLL